MGRYGDIAAAITGLTQGYNTSQERMFREQELAMRREQLAQQARMQEEAAARQKAELAFRQEEMEQRAKDKERNFRQQYADSMTLADLLSRSQPDNPAWQNLNQRAFNLTNALTPTMVPGEPAGPFLPESGASQSFKDWNVWDKSNPTAQARQQSFTRAPGPYISNAPYPFTAISDSLPSPNLLSDIYSSGQRFDQQKEFAKYSNDLSMDRDKKDAGYDYMKALSVAQIRADGKTKPETPEQKAEKQAFKSILSTYNSKMESFKRRWVTPETDTLKSVMLDKNSRYLKTAEIEELRGLYDAAKKMAGRLNLPEDSVPVFFPDIADRLQGEKRIADETEAERVEADKKANSFWNSPGKWADKTLNGWLGSDSGTSTIRAPMGIQPTTRKPGPVETSIRNQTATTRDIEIMDQIIKEFPNGISTEEAWKIYKKRGGK